MRRRAHGGDMRPSSILCALMLAHAAAAQQSDNAQRYVKTNTMIAMRDGVRLNTDIYAPRGATGALPVVYLRTPYGIDSRAGSLNGSFKELADDGYIFVFQDIRGRYKSEGSFVMQRPARSTVQRKNAKAIDE